MVNESDAGRLAALVFRDIGMDVPGLLKELEQIPKRILAGKRRLRPLKLELDGLREHYSARAQQPSQADLDRKALLSELMEEARTVYNQRPDLKDDPKKGGKVKIELTDGRAEALAHAHPRYRDRLAQMSADRKRMAELAGLCREIYDVLDHHKQRMAVIRDFLKHAEGLEHCWSAEARLTPR